MRNIFMKCIDVKENIDALLDGELETPQKRKIESHLESCAFCRTEFEHLSAVGTILKSATAISIPPTLDEKVLTAFRDLSDEKHCAKIGKFTETKKAGWFGIPRFAFAAALLLFALGITSAFQLGKMSGGEISVLMPEVQITDNSFDRSKADFAENIQPNNENDAPLKPVEVPVIREKIVKVPVYTEKIVTRTVYKKAETKTEGNFPQENFSSRNRQPKESKLSSRLKDNRYSTQLNLEGFQIIRELKPQIIKGENDEK